MTARAAAAGVAPALKIIDSRYKDLKFSVTDVTTGNCFSALVAGA
jgi:2-keto-4-pentenoate hydratase